MDVCARAALGTAFPGDEGAEFPEPGVPGCAAGGVLTPWSAATPRTIRATFLRGRRVWSTRVSTPLDGQLSVAVRGSFDVQLLDRGRSMARAGWSGGGGRSLEYRVCGGRSFELRVTRGGAARNVALRLTQP